MKILMVSEDIPQPHLGGLGKHVIALAHELHSRGHTVDVLGNSDCNIEQHPEQSGPGRFFGRITGHQRGWKQQRIGAFHALANFANVQLLARKIVESAAGYDIVHYHGHLPWVANKIPASIPFIQTRHDQGGDCILKTRFLKSGELCSKTDPIACAYCATSNPNALQSTLSAAAVRIMRQQTARAFDSHPAVFVSDFLQRNFARVSGAGFQGEVVHHGIDTGALRRAVSAAKPFESERRSVELFTAGAMTAYKGFGMLLDAIRAQGLPADFRLTIAGDGPELARLRAEYSSPQINFLGWCDYSKVLAYTLWVDAVVVPSVWEEAFGSTTLEALALGRVVYALRRGGTPELARYAGDGGARLRLYDSISELTVGLLNHRGGAQDPVASLSEFSGSMEAMAEKILNLYSLVLERPFGFAADRS